MAGKYHFPNKSLCSGSLGNEYKLILVDFTTHSEWAKCRGSSTLHWTSPQYPAKVHYFSNEEKRYRDPHKKPFGYQWSREQGYILIPQEAEAVRLIFKYYLEGWQISDISRKLTADGYGSFRGKISRKLIAYTLDSDFYLGTRRIKAQFSESGQEEIIENDHEPLVTQEMFYAVQERRQSEYNRWKGRCKNSKRDGHPRQHP